MTNNNFSQIKMQADGSLYLGFGDNEPVFTRKPAPKRQSLNLDFAEIARIQREREEIMIQHAPITAKMWGLI